MTITPRRQQSTLAASGALANGVARTTLLFALVLLTALVVWWMHAHGRDDRAAAVAPLPVAARGDLAADERNNIDVFKRVSPSVVHITTLASARWLAFDVMEIPRGTGSGFIWDRAGHVVTNFHVIQGGSGARAAPRSGNTIGSSFFADCCGTVQVCCS